MNLCNPSTVRALMEEQGISFRKEFGQNFLIQSYVPENIADACSPTENCAVLEIGPGIGCLTSCLAQRYKKVIAVEIDHGLIPILHKTLAEFENVTVIEGDVMKTDLAALVRDYADGLPICVCANLPYYITTPILMYLIESGVPFSSVTVMVQDEVATRLCSAPGKKDYGAITAVLNYYGTLTKLFKVPAGCFMPAPNVDSAVIRIDMFSEKKYHPTDEAFFFRLLHAAFEQRRKTFVNSVNASLSISKENLVRALESVGLSADIRAERIGVSDFVQLSDLLISCHE